MLEGKKNAGPLQGSRIKFPMFAIRRLLYRLIKRLAIGFGFEIRTGNLLAFKPAFF